MGCVVTGLLTVLVFWLRCPNGRNAYRAWREEPIMRAGAANFLNAMLWDARPGWLAATVYLHVSWADYLMASLLIEVGC